VLNKRMRLVYEWCESSGLSPKIEYWHSSKYDPGDETDGFYIQVTWPVTAEKESFLVARG